MKHAFSVVVVALVLVACKIELHADKDKATTAVVDPPPPHDPGEHIDEPAPVPPPRAGTRPTTTVAAKTAAPTNANAVAGCGVIEPSTTACGQCLTQKCCAQGRACEPDATCKSCVSRGAASLTDASCRANALYSSVHACVNGPCTEPCNGGGGGGGAPRAASCNQTRCSDGPGGNSMCKARGCGNCSFGACLMF